DGQLYLCGLSVWQSNAGKEGAFHRVRYNGKPVHMPCDLHVVPSGVELSFTSPLEEKSAIDPENYGIEQWIYKWTSNYGSPEFSVKNPDEKVHDTVELKSVKLSSDRKTVLLEIPDLKPVMQMKIKYHVTAADGTSLNQEVFNTIHRVPASIASKH
ncbi:MAG: heme-binding protein, partial [Verrucomicrobiota bacterium]